MRAILVVVVLHAFAPEIVFGRANYEIVLEKAIMKGNKDYIIVRSSTMDKYNRTTTVFNMNFTLVRDYTEQTTIGTTCYEKMKNLRYSMIPMPLPSYGLCELTKTQNMIWPDVKATLKSPTNKDMNGCPFTKGDYYLRNYMMNPDHMPDQLPGNGWRCDITLKNGNIVIITGSMFFHIDRDI